MLSRNNYTPDVLDCLANLSNDEVFTPPAIVNQMLDMLPQEIFADKHSTFLDPFTKSGVFLREITKRLLEHQVPDYKKTANEIEYVTKEAIQNAVRTGELDLNDEDYERKARTIGDAAIKNHPDANKYLNFEVDLQNALDHILRNQVFGIAITELTAHLARRSLYCSKDASGRYSIVGTEFGDNADGNIRFKPMKHKWRNNTCIYCGASASTMDRPNDFESHAYEMLHTEKPEEIFNMEFTVICGNPPYQLNDGGNAASASPLYHRFVEQALRLNPKYLTMITPSRWFAGGKGLDAFREKMLNDHRICKMVDFINAKDCFPGNSVSGGVNYFLWDRDYNGKCEFTTVMNGNKDVAERNLDEYEVFVRFNKAIEIIHRIDFSENLISILSSRNPFGLTTAVRGEEKTFSGAIKVISSKGIGYIRKKDVLSNSDLIDQYKVMISRITYEHAGEPDKEGTLRILSKMEILGPGEVCTDSYIVAYGFGSLTEAENFMSYLKCKFTRFLILQTLSSINLSKERFMFVPLQDFNKSWNDAELYKKYSLSQDEIDFIESIIKPMD